VDEVDLSKMSGAALGLTPPWPVTPVGVFCHMCQQLQVLGIDHQSHDVGDGGYFFGGARHQFAGIAG